MEYITVSKSAQAEFVEKRSRFIGYCAPVQTEEEALDFIESIRSQHREAKHNVYAYSVRKNNISRFTDDGEPSGTAGMPVLSVLQKGQICDTAIVVTRYFGGILLGTGGLVHAYSKAASMAVDQAQRIIMRECRLCELSCDYGDYGRVGAIIPELGGVVDATDFTDLVTLHFHIDESSIEQLNRRLADASCGRCAAVAKNSEFFAFDFNK